MKKVTTILSMFLMLFIIVGSINVNAATKISLSKTEITVEEGETTKLSLNGAGKAIKWKTTNKNIATVSSKGKIKAVKKGTCYIKAFYNNKIYKCKVRVEEPAIIIPFYYANGQHRLQYQYTYGYNTAVKSYLYYNCDINIGSKYTYTIDDPDEIQGETDFGHPDFSIRSYGINYLTGEEGSFTANITTGGGRKVKCKFQVISGNSITADDVAFIKEIPDNQLMTEGTNFGPIVIGSSVKDVYKTFGFCDSGYIKNGIALFYRYTDTSTNTEWCIDVNVDKETKCVTKIIYVNNDLNGPIK